MEKFTYNRQANPVPVETPPAGRALSHGLPGTYPLQLVHYEAGQHQQVASKPESVPLFLRVLPFLLLWIVALSVFAESVDDSFITFRFAANALAGHGPVFNVGERVEGFTSPLHLLACMALLKIAPSVGMLFKAKLLSLLFGTLLLVQMRRLALRMNLSPRAAILAQCLLALNVNFAVSAVNGLETTLYACLLLASLDRFLFECRSPQFSGVGSAGLLFLTLLARPETLLIFAALLGVRLYWNRRRGLPLRRSLAWALTFLVPFGLLALARIAYFGLPLPNTYYAKQMSLGAAIPLGARYLLRTVLIYHIDGAGSRWVQLGMAAKAFLCAGLFWGLALVGFLRARRELENLACGAIILATVVFILRAGGDWMYGTRFLVGALAPLVALQCKALEIRGRRKRASGNVLHLPFPANARLSPAWTLGVIALWCLGCLSAPSPSWSSVRYSTHDADYVATKGAAGVRLAAYFHDNLPRGAAIAYSEMGYSPYVNLDKKFIDTRGLLDHEIASLPESKTPTGLRGDCLYLKDSPLRALLLRRQPDVIVSMGMDMPGKTAPEIEGYSASPFLEPSNAARHARPVIANWIYHREKSPGVENTRQ